MELHCIGSRSYRDPILIFHPAKYGQQTTTRLSMESFHAIPIIFRELRSGVQSHYIQELSSAALKMSERFNNRDT